jgi:hypothetical protein
MPTARPAGITIAAILNLIGSAFLGLLGLVSLFGLVAQVAVQPPEPGAIRVMQFIGVVLFLALSAWGVTTGIGLLRLRNWARISQLVFAALMLFGGISGALTIPFLPFPTPPNDPDPALTQKIFSGMKIGGEIFYILCAILALYWLFYFARRSTADVFNSGGDGAGANSQQRPPWGPSTSAVSRAAEPFRGPMNAGRPISISIIAALLLLGLLSIPLAPLLGTPFILFGKMFYGWHGVLAATPLIAMQAGSCYGLLKMRLWGRTLAILTLLFGAANSALMWILPGSQQRFDELMQQQLSKMALPPNFVMPHFPAALMALGVVPILAIELFFLIKEKPAFIAAEAKAAMSRR